MKIFTPNKRLINLGLVLQYDSFKKDNGKAGYFTQAQRTLINQERGRIFNELDNYIQPPELEEKIQFLMDQIKSNNWNPLIPVEYKY